MITRGKLPQITVLIALLAALFPNGSIQSDNERALLKMLLKDYEPLERPVSNESEPVKVTFGIDLQQIIDVDEKNQIISTNVWLKYEWKDSNLVWDPDDYGGITNIRIAPSKIWKPDILMYNSADERFDGSFPVNVVVLHDGNCTHIPPGIFKSTCKINIAWFPFDEQECPMKFGSWTYDGFGLDLTNASEAGETAGFIANGEWTLIGVPAKLNIKKYECCPAPYYDVTYTIVIRRRTLYYTYNLLIPCFLISTMTLLVFILPPDSGEKLTLCVTILLSLMVFLLLVAETMPATSDAVPLIGTYFACIMIMCAMSVATSVLVLNFHHRTAEMYRMSPFMRKLFLNWLPRILRMERPVDKEREKRLLINSKLKELELKERCSRSLLANVLDLDDDFKSGNNFLGNCTKTGNVYETDNNVHAGVPNSARSELSFILKELSIITDRLRQEENERMLNNDWKFAAMVIDRASLWLFSIYTIVSSAAVMAHSPNLFS